MAFLLLHHHRRRPTTTTVTLQCKRGAGPLAGCFRSIRGDFLHWFACLFGTKAFLVLAAVRRWLPPDYHWLNVSEAPNNSVDCNKGVLRTELHSLSFTCSPDSIYYSGCLRAFIETAQKISSSSSFLLVSPFMFYFEMQHPALLLLCQFLSNELKLVCRWWPLRWVATPTKRCWPHPLRLPDFIHSHTCERLNNAFLCRQL